MCRSLHQTRLHLTRLLTDCTEGQVNRAAFAQACYRRQVVLKGGIAGNGDVAIPQAMPIARIGDESGRHWSNTQNK